MTAWRACYSSIKSRFYRQGRPWADLEDAGRSLWVNSVKIVAQELGGVRS